MPLVSVVLIFLDEERFIDEAVQSVREQTLTDWELILVDDGSTDRSTQKARALAATDDRVRYVEHPAHQNRGMSASRNLGVANATAPYVAFLDADDVWMPDNLAAQIQLLKNMPDVAMIVGTPEYWHSWDRTSTKHDRTVLPGGMAERRLDPPEAVLALHPLGAHPGVGVIGLVRRDAFDAIGGFEPRFRGLFEDQVFRAKICLRYPVYITSRSGYRYRQHAASCCARTSMKEYMRLRATYLDWFEEDRERVKDPRVRTAVRRARLKRPYLMFRRLIVDSLPSGFKERVQDILAT